MKDFIKSVENSTVYDVAEVSELTSAPQLSVRFKNNIYLKREDEQPIFSFKLRGAYQKISTLTKDQLNKGVITSSAGNHAQGVALAAKKLGITAVIVMPVATPKIKVKSVERLGGKVVLHGDVYDDAYQYAKQLEKEQDMVYIAPFDDIQTVIGQATIGKEILDQLQNVDLVFVPVGGGGLIAGVAGYIKSMNDKVKIIGVEPEDSPTLHHAMRDGKRTILEEVGRFADGVAVKQIGEVTFEFAKKYVDDVILVSNDQMCAAIKDIYEDVRSG